MTHTATEIIPRTIAALAAPLALAACDASYAAEEIAVAELAVYMDVSRGSVLTESDAFHASATAFVQEQAGQLMTGDRISFSLMGDNSFELTAQNTQFTTSLGRQAMADLVPQIPTIMDDMIAPHLGDEGEDWTNILSAIQNTPPDCTSDRSAVIVFTDGMENGSEYSAQHAIRDEVEIVFPQPTERFLEGCRVTLWGVGKSGFNPRLDNDEMLTQTQIAALKAAWREWLVAAGASTVTFAS